MRILSRFLTPYYRAQLSYPLGKLCGGSGNIGCLATLYRGCTLVSSAKSMTTKMFCNSLCQRLGLILNNVSCFYKADEASLMLDECHYLPRKIVAILINIKA
ncbi:MAG: hypothetical protein OFPII_41400 [Osedax symbiont Rs1]|nr:MAG: hypothetical protein OFPII_41400 [Osedax symbiont Rs1]